MGCSHNGAQCFSLLWLPKKQAKALRPKDPYISENMGSASLILYAVAQ